MRARADIFRAVFPDIKVVHLVRRDVVRQAVSWARAAQDGVWVVSESEAADPAAQPVYDYEFVSNLVVLLLRGERGWNRFSGQLGLIPHKVVYEDLVNEDSYRAVIRGILLHLQLDDRAEIQPPRTLRQADETNDDWVGRFLAEARTRNHPALRLLLRRHVPTHAAV